MRLSTRRTASLALLTLVGLASFGCGGDSGNQPTSVSTTLRLESALAYPADADAATPSDPSNPAVQPLATLGARSDQRITLWGTRESMGTVSEVTSVYESAYTSARLQNLKDGAHTIYSRYDADGNLLSILDSVTGAYITFSAFTPASAGSGDGSIDATGFDPATGKTAIARATLTGDRINVAVIDDGSGNPRAKATKSFALPDASPSRATRSDEGAAALTGLLSFYRGSAPRTKIIATVFKAASLVVEKDFGGIVTDSGNALLLDQLQRSYSGLLDLGITPEVAANGDFPTSAFRNDLPVPAASAS